VEIGTIGDKAILQVIDVAPVVRPIERCVDILPNMGTITDHIRRAREKSKHVLERLLLVLEERSRVNIKRLRFIEVNHFMITKPVDDPTDESGFPKSI
jgi:hypothetical protein